MSQTVKYRVTENAISAFCTKPRARCYLCDMFAPLRNMLVFNERKKDGRFEVTVFLRNRHEYNVQQGKAAVLDVMKQICPQCQKQR